MKTKILLLLLTLQLYNTGNSQNIEGLKYYYKNLESITEIIFNVYSKKEKKIFANWEKYDNLNKVIITEKYDSFQLFQLIENISANENISELCISFGNFASFKLPELPYIKSLKIYNSTHLNSNFFLENESIFKQIHQFSFINNHKIIDKNLLLSLKNIKQLELVDTSINVVDNETIDNLYQLEKLENLTISYKQLQPINTEKLKSLNNFIVLNLENLNNKLTIFNLLATNELNTHNFNIGNKITLNYFNQKTTYSKSELANILTITGLDKYPTTNNNTIIDLPRTSNSTNKTQLNTIIDSQVEKNTDYIKNTTYFKKPIEDIILNENVFQLKQSKDTIITLQNGTKITIPEQCFTNKNGELITENIKIIYKEYNTPLSIFASGIPMSTIVNGEAKTLTSAGMFEIQVYSNNEELQIKNGKTIDIDFASIDDGKKYNFYEFSKISNTWVEKNINLPKDTLPTQTIQNNYLNTVNTYKNVYFNSGNLPDTNKFNTRFSNFDYFYLSKENSNFGTARYSEHTINKRTNKRKSYRLNTTTKALKNKKNLVRLINIPKEIYDSTQAVILGINENFSLKYFPELIAFSNYKFYNDECKKYRKFKEKYFKDKIYSDVRVKYNEGDDYCTFILKGETEMDEIDLKIYDEYVTKPRRQNSIKRSFSKRIKNYERKLYEREIAFNNLVEKEYNIALRKNSKRALTNPLNDSNINKVVTWLKPVNASRRIQLVKTGLYNCDVQYEYVQAKVFAVNLKDKEDTEINFNTIYIFDKNANTYFKYDTKNIIFQPETLMGVIATTSSGALYFLDKLNTKDLNLNDSKATFTMNKPDEKINSLEKLLSLFKF